jgi:hypothetical protein
MSSLKTRHFIDAVPDTDRGDLRVIFLATVKLQKRISFRSPRENSKKYLRPIKVELFCVRWYIALLCPTFPAYQTHKSNTSPHRRNLNVKKLLLPLHPCGMAFLSENLYQNTLLVGAMFA